MTFKHELNMSFVTSCYKQASYGDICVEITNAVWISIRCFLEIMHEYQWTTIYS